jgi:hypothetical protein
MGAALGRSPPTDGADHVDINRMQPPFRPAREIDHGADTGQACRFDDRRKLPDFLDSIDGAKQCGIVTRYQKHRQIAIICGDGHQHVAAVLAGRIHFGDHSHRTQLLQHRR